MFNYILTSSGELYHYGVKGMRWGIRRRNKKFKNVDRAFSKLDKNTEKLRKKQKSMREKLVGSSMYKKAYDIQNKFITDDVRKRYAAYGIDIDKAISQSRKVMENEKLFNETMDYVVSASRNPELRSALTDAIYNIDHRDR